MKVLVPTGWLEAVEEEVASRGLAVELVGYDKDHPGPFPDAEVLFRGEGAWNWSEVLANAPAVRWVHLTSAGVEYAIQRTAPRGITLTESGEVYRICIGEFVLAQMLFAAKRLGRHRDRQHGQCWAGFQHEELAGTTVGIIGLGPIGLGVAERAKAFGMKVVGCRRSGAPIEDVSDVVGLAQLDRLLDQSDYVVLACPLTEQTRGLIDAGALGRMKPTAWLINIARGAVVDTKALIEALRAGQLAGACLDVTDPEPLPADHPLWSFPNVLITPHNASGDAQPLRRRKVKLLADNLQLYLAGKELPGQVDYERGY